MKQWFYLFLAIGSAFTVQCFIWGPRVAIKVLFAWTGLQLMRYLRRRLA